MSINEQARSEASFSERRALAEQAWRDYRATTHTGGLEDAVPPWFGAGFTLGMAAERARAAALPPEPSDADRMHDAVGRAELISEARELVSSWDQRGSWNAESPVGMVDRLANALEAAGAVLAARPTPEPSADVREALAHLVDWKLDGDAGQNVGEYLADVILSRYDLTPKTPNQTEGDS